MGYFIDFKEFVVRSVLLLTNSYVVGELLTNVHNANQLIINVAFVKGSLTSAELKVEFSNDGVTYHQEASESITAGLATVSQVVRQFTTEGNYRITIPIRDRYVRISTKGTSSAAGSTMGITAVVGTV